MKVYNATDSQLTLPISGSGKYITVKPHSFSTSFLGTIDFLSLLITIKTPEQIAIVAGGPAELSVCAQVPTCARFVVQSDTEAIQRFMVPDLTKTKEEVKTELVDVEESVISTTKVTATVTEDELDDKLVVPTVSLGTSTNPGVGSSIKSGVTGAVVEKTVAAPVEDEVIEFKYETSAPVESADTVVEPVKKRKYTRKVTTPKAEETQIEEQPVVKQKRVYRKKA